MAEIASPSIAPRCYEFDDVDADSETSSAEQEELSAQEESLSTAGEDSGAQGDHVQLRPRGDGNSSRERRTRKEKTMRIARLTFEDLKPYFSLPLHQAATKLNLCGTVLKRVSRRCGIATWPFRHIRDLNSRIESLQALLRNSNKCKDKKLDAVRREIGVLTKNRDKALETGQLSDVRQRHSTQSKKTAVGQSEAAQASTSPLEYARNYIRAHSSALSSPSYPLMVPSMFVSSCPVNDPCWPSTYCYSLGHHGASPLSRCSEIYHGVEAPCMVPSLSPGNVCWEKDCACMSRTSPRLMEHDPVQQMRRMQPSMSWQHMAPHQLAMPAHLRAQALAQARSIAPSVDLYGTGNIFPIPARMPETDHTADRQAYLQQMWGRLGRIPDPRHFAAVASGGACASTHGELRSKRVSSPARSELAAARKNDRTDKSTDEENVQQLKKQKRERDALAVAHYV